jgi:hypothetical protein
VKLFIGNIPKIKTKDELKQEFCKIVGKNVKKKLIK